MDSKKSDICVFCYYARMKKDICGIYCAGSFWKKQDGTCDHFEDYAEHMQDQIRDMVSRFPSADVAPVRHARWILEAHDERVNYRWNVTAECSECCDERKEIWAGFFPGVPSPIAKDVALASAESVKLSNYCPNCGAKMDGDRNG